MNSISLLDYTKTPLGPGLMYLYIQALGFLPLLKGSKQVSGWSSTLSTEVRSQQNEVPVTTETDTFPPHMLHCITRWNKIPY